MRFKKTRSGKGTIAIELSLVALLLLIFSMLIFNMVMAVWGFSILDQVARNAARAAGAATSKSDALTIAQQVAKSCSTDGVFVSQPTVAEKDFLFVTNPNGTNPPSGSPYVIVRARNTVKMPVPILFFDAHFKDGTLNYSRTYTYPILGVPYTASNNGIVPENPPALPPDEPPVTPPTTPPTQPPSNPPKNPPADPPTKPPKPPKDPKPKPPENPKPKPPKSPPATPPTTPPTTPPEPPPEPPAAPEPPKPPPAPPPG